MELVSAMTWIAVSMARVLQVTAWQAEKAMPRLRRNLWADTPGQWQPLGQVVCDKRQEPSFSPYQYDGLVVQYLLPWQCEAMTSSTTTQSRLKSTSA